LTRACGQGGRRDREDGDNEYQPRRESHVHTLEARIDGLAFQSQHPDQHSCTAVEAWALET
jgi:hypothetical protein